jgi:methane/ammonia monooxygenase subunit B
MRASHILVLAALLVFIGSGCGAAFAHGEAADKPFLKDLTTAFYDVQITPTTVQVGQPVTITGKVKILSTWPYTLPAPEIGYITPVVPGPQLALIDRTVNGQEATGSILINREGVYDFKMVLEGRQPGRWHVHPGFAVKNVGTLIGPGEWITVLPTAGGFHLQVPLATTGKTVDIETLGSGFVWWWAFLGLIPGLSWMVYWTVPKPTVTRLAVNVQIPPSDDGRDIGLVTAADHRWCDWLAGITVLILLAGWIGMASAYPVRIPQQTDWFVPTPPPAQPRLAEVQALGATYNEPDPMQPGTLVMNVQVKNVGSSPLKVTRYVMAMSTFLSSDNAGPVTGPQDFVQKALTVTPATPIAPGETRTLSLTMASTQFHVERLIPYQDPQQQIAGLLTVENAAGQSEDLTITSGVESKIGAGYGY